MPLCHRVAIAASLKRYWFEFDSGDSNVARATHWVGVTAWTLDDARALVSQHFYGGDQLPPITKVIEDVDVSTVDRNHVQRNMAPANLSGIWYPLGHQ
jgi:hypothetical protein